MKIQLVDKITKSGTGLHYKISRVESLTPGLVQYVLSNPTSPLIPCGECFIPAYGEPTASILFFKAEKVSMIHSCFARKIRRGGDWGSWVWKFRPVIGNLLLVLNNLMNFIDIKDMTFGGMFKWTFEIKDCNQSSYSKMLYANLECGVENNEGKSLTIAHLTSIGRAIDKLDIEKLFLRNNARILRKIQR